MNLTTRTCEHGQRSNNCTPCAQKAVEAAALAEAVAANDYWADMYEPPIV